MPPRVRDDWSDSEDDQSDSEVETSVLLGVPDGDINEPQDLSDPAVSRIGGLPAFLPTRELAWSSSHCKSCSRPMPLLVQMWCPFEGSAMDRALYIWGCERPACQHNNGSVRVWRGLKFNPKYAAKLAKKKAREAEKLKKEAAEKARVATEAQARRLNPFTPSANTSTEMTFGLGSQLFGSATPAGGHDHSDSSGANSEDEEGDDDVNDTIQRFETTTLESAAPVNEWPSSPAYKPIYLSTISEYLPRFSTSKVNRQGQIDEPAEYDDKNAGKDWGLEEWEKSVDVDGVFERFVKRVSNENDQCVRYDLKGTPLPFGSRDKVYEKLWPPPPPAPFTTKPGFAVPTTTRRVYDASSLDKCAACGGPRVFECQLMPNLINILRAQGNPTRDRTQDGDSQNTSQEPPTGEEHRKRELEKALKDGMGWGTCFIFSCERDCCPGDKGWMEELVIVQWDD